MQLYRRRAACGFDSTGEPQTVRIPVSRSRAMLRMTASSGKMIPREIQTSEFLENSEVSMGS
jgi:hypothetical protein